MLLVAPIILPFLTASFCWLLRKRPAMRRVLSLAGALGLFAVALTVFLRVLESGPFAEAMGGWPAPFGIVLGVDLFSATLLLLTGLVTVAIVTFGFSELPERAEEVGHHAMMHMMAAGVSGAFVTADIFNLYVWFEVLLIGSFGLMVAGEGRKRLDGAIRYAALNLLATLAFLAGVGLLYAATGTLNMADLRSALPERASEAQQLVIAAFLLFAFGAKAAMFPVFAWLPASYHTPNFTVSAAFSALLTKVGVYAAIRTFTVIFPADTPFVSDILLWGGVATLLCGVFGALTQDTLRRVLGFQVVASIGFIMTAYGLDSEAGLVASIFYLWQDMLVKAALFMAAWLVAWRLGAEDFKHGGGMWRVAPWLSALFLLPALALAGIPPLPGFWAKLLIVAAALDDAQWIIAGLALLGGALTLYSMGRLWAEMIWEARSEAAPALVERVAAPKAALWTVIALCAMLVAIGLTPGVTLALAEQAAAGLLDPSAYVAAVMGAGR